MTTINAAIQRFILSGPLATGVSGLSTCGPPSRTGSSSGAFTTMPASAPSLATRSLRRSSGNKQGHTTQKRESLELRKGLSKILFLYLNWPSSPTLTTLRLLPSPSTEEPLAAGWEPIAREIWPYWIEAELLFCLSMHKEHKQCIVGLWSVKNIMLGFFNTPYYSFVV